MNSVTDIYKKTYFQMGKLISANKHVGNVAKNGVLFSYYILDIEYPNGIIEDHHYYPDDKIVDLIGRTIFFDCLPVESDKIITHIYKSSEIVLQ